MLTSRIRGKFAPFGERNSDDNKRNTAETQASNTQNMKGSIDRNLAEIKDQIQKEEKIQDQDKDLVANNSNVNRKTANIQTKFKLPLNNFTNKWTPNFQIVYHQFPPQSTQHHAFLQQYQATQKIHQQISHNWGKSIDTEFSNILIQDTKCKHYCSPMPYGFDAKRSRIIVGDRSIRQYIDCTYQQFVNRMSESQQAQSDSQFRGIKLTKKKQGHK